jgi:mannose-1-phosphate guanylyltransferase/phosphomannomutase
MAANGSGEFIFPGFQATSDGLMATAKLLESLALQQTTLSEVVAGLPPFHMERQTVSCPWEAKGIVMRRLNQHFHQDQIDTTDGIKVRFNKTDWVLLLPDPDFPLFQIHAEAASQSQAEALITRIVDMVADLQK